MMRKTAQNTMRSFLKNDRGNLPSAAVFVVVLALIIVGTATAVSTSGNSVHSAMEANELLQRQATAADNRYVDMLNQANTLPKGENVVTDEGRENAYQTLATGSFKGIDGAGQPVWDTNKELVKYKFNQVVNVDTLNCGLNKAGISCWGKAVKGEAGNGQATFQSNSPKVVIPASVKEFSMLFAFKNNLCGAEKTTNFLWCWGANTHKTFGTATIISQPFKVGTEAVSTNYEETVAISDNTFCMVTASRKVLCNGVMDGDATTSTALKIMKDATVNLSGERVLATNNTALIFTTDNTKRLYSMTANSKGAPGVTTTALSAPKLTTYKGEVDKISLVSASDGDSALFIKGSSLYGFGMLYPGDGTARKNVLVPTRLDAGILTSDDHWLEDFVQTPGGTICTTSNDNATYEAYSQCWGEGSQGELGKSSREDELSPSQLMFTPYIAPFQSFLKTSGNTICGIEQVDKRVTCWGDNSNSQASQNVKNTSLTQTDPTMFEGNESMTSGGFVTPTIGCMTFQDKTLACWGNNRDGGVGIGVNGAVRLPQTELFSHVEERALTTLKKVG